MSSSILIIDDADSVRSHIIGTLKKVGLFEQYREARDGIDGFKSLIASKPDVVICDLEMPRMDGFKFLQMVNTREDLKDIPIIIISGYDMPRHSSGVEGVAAYFVKPFDPAKLIAEIGKHI